jgi:hypothetical protein
MFNTVLLMVTLALSSTTGGADPVGARLCAAQGEAGSDAHEACLCTLNTFRCEVQGTCADEVGTWSDLPVVGEVAEGCDY